MHIRPVQGTLLHEVKDRVLSPRGQPCLDKEQEVQDSPADLHTASNTEESWDWDISAPGLECLHQMLQFLASTCISQTHSCFPTPAVIGTEEMTRQVETTEPPLKFLASCIWGSLGGEKVSTCKHLLRSGPN